MHTASWSIGPGDWPGHSWVQLYWISWGDSMWRSSRDKLEVEQKGVKGSTCCLCGVEGSVDGFHLPLDKTAGPRIQGH